MEGVEGGRYVPAGGDANEESGEQKATREVGRVGEGAGRGEEEEEGGDEGEEAEVDPGQQAAADVEDDDVDTWEQRPMRMTRQQKRKN